MKLAFELCLCQELVRQLPLFVHRGLLLIDFVLKAFLPAKSKARKDKLENIAEEDRTLIFYESTHRILDTLEDMQAVLGEERYIVLAREMTKTWETITGNTIKNLREWL